MLLYVVFRVALSWLILEVTVFVSLLGGSVVVVGPDVIVNRVPVEQTYGFNSVINYFFKRVLQVATNRFITDKVASLSPSDSNDIRYRGGNSNVRR